MDGYVKLQEKRGAERRIVDKRGRVSDHEGEIVAVKIRDLSATGAGLETADCDGLPNHFELLIVDDCLLHQATVRWRRGDRLGVEFVGMPRKVLGSL
jgi:hypothetical protein